MKNMMTRAFAKTKQIAVAAKENMSAAMDMLTADELAEAFMKNAAIASINFIGTELVEKKYQFDKHPAWVNYIFTFANSTESFKKVKRMYNVYNAIVLATIGAAWAYKEYQERA